MADAGWYPDPQDSNAEQYWDGQVWTGQRRAAGSGGVGNAGGADQSSGQETRVNPVVQPTPQPGYQQPGYQQPGYQQPQSAQPGYQQPGYQQPQSAQPGYQQPGYQQPQSAQPGYQQPGYQQPGFQQPQSAQPGFQQPGFQQPGYAQPGYQQGQPAGAHPWAATPAAGPSKKRRNLIVAAGVVVVLVAAGLVAWLVLPGDDAPSITYQGKAIKDADTVLSAAETSVTRTVTSRHGVRSKDTRCYFVQAEKPAGKAKKSDIDSSLSCGPVLFVDGNAAQEFLPVPLTGSTSGGKAVLTAESSLAGIDPSSLRSGYQLVRPDGEKPPSGNGGLTVPAPPPTGKDSVTSASLGSTPAPASLTGAVMVGRTSKVTVPTAGFITRYGTGTDARSAPSGQKLLAFRTTLGAGELSSGTGAQVKLIVDGTPHDVPTPGTGNYVVASVPASSTPTLQLIDSGTTQTLSLPQGKPGSTNLAVLTRLHRTDVLGNRFNVPVQLRKGNRRVNVTFRATATLATLDYWPPVNTSVQPSRPGDALLSVRVNYTESGVSGGPFGFDPSLLRLKLPNGSYVKARNVARPGKIANVFEVPAGFTTGIVQITGTQRASGGVTATVRATKQLAISIPAG